MKLKIMAASLVLVLALPQIAAAETASVTYQHTEYLRADYADPWDLYMDAAGNYYHAGSFSNTGALNFNPSGSDPRTSAGVQDGYVTKYNSDNTYAWTRTISGASQQYVFGITADASGNVYAVGSFQGSNVNFNEAGSELRSSSGSSDVFITKFSATGTHLWTLTYGGTGLDAADSIAVDSNGDIIVKGTYNGTMDFDPGAGTVSHTSTASSWDSFISKFSSAGVHQWTNVFASNDYVDGTIALDTSNNIFFGGSFRGTTDLDPSAGTNSVVASGADAVIMKLNSTGSPVWTKVITGSGNENIDDIAVRGTSLLVGGSFSSASVNFNPDGTDTKTKTGTDNAFMSHWTTNGTYGWTRAFGNNTAGVEGVTLDQYGGAYGTGNFSGTSVNFNPAGSDLHSTSAGEDDTFITKFTKDGDHQWAKTSVGGDSNFAVDLEVTSTLNVLSFGQLFADAAGVNLNPDGSDVYGDNTTFDIYLTRWSQDVNQEIQNVPANITLKDNAGNPLPADAFTPGQVVNVSLVDTTSSAPVVAVPLALSSDVDWSTVTMGTDPVAGKAFVHGLGAATGTSGNHTLYIPKLDGQDAVIICPDATNLSEVTATCSNKQELTAASPNVSIQTIGGKSYWVVTGLSGTGGLGTVLGASTSATGSTLVNTGSNALVTTAFGALLIFTPLLLFRSTRTYRLRS